MPARHSAFLPALVLAAAAPILPAAQADDDAVSFNRDIRQILSDNCFACHGPDKHKREADRRLDTEAGAYADNEGIRAIVPGDLAASDLWERIGSKDPDEIMPPPKSEKKLTPGQIELFKKWIEQGAKYEPHWAFIPPKRPAERGKAEFGMRIAEWRQREPGSAADIANAEARARDWGRNPIDGFILDRLLREGLAPSPEASRETLIRRVAYDLTGLPPELAEVDAFLADPSPDAYEKVVDRLLASPRYGERMAIPWLDLARYADTHGYHLDSGREQWPWRDWVIEAFNKNLPFDRFAEWQVAGDLLPDATLEQRLATGFVRNNMINFEGGAIAEEYLAAYVKDRVNTVGTVFLGLTVGCAECHDHKFDPILQRDFYQLYAYFNAVPEKGLDGAQGNAAPLLELPSGAEVQADIDTLAARVAAAEEEFRALEAAADAGFAEWEKSAIAAKPAEWVTAEIVDAKSSGGAEFQAQADGSRLATGANAGSDVFEFTTRGHRGRIAGLRLEALTDESLPGKGPGRAPNGNFVLTGIEVEAAPAGDPAKFAPVPLAGARADFEQEGFSIANALDAGARSGWAVDGNARHETRTAWFAAEKPFGFDGGAIVRVRLRFESQFGRHAIGRPRLALTDDANVLPKTVLPADIAALAGVPRDAAQEKKLRDHHRAEAAPGLRDEKKKLDALKKELAGAKAKTPTVMVMRQMDPPRPSFILERGQYDQPRDPVEPGIPASLGTLPPGAPKNRLALARWFIDPQNPLMARVTVNRFWAEIMGIGIVKTVNDFGSQGEWPKHPELLDWMAREFIDSGWDVKHLMRLIVTSATYRQSSHLTPGLIERDPENRLLARGPRFRLPAESIRDTALAVSGLLEPRIGGPSVYPYQPPGLWQELSSRGDSKKWSAQFFEQSHGADLHRRSLYTFWKRTCPPPQMLTFDAPDREVCTAARARTNTPLQALVLMNDPTYVESARKLAERMMRESGPAAADRIRFGFRLLTVRNPGEREEAMLAELFAKSKARYAQQPEAAAKLLSEGEAPRDETLDPAELAAWTIVASTILNLDETLTKG